MWGLRIMAFRSAASLMTAQIVVSKPVPLVVGTATRVRLPEKGPTPSWETARSQVMSGCSRNTSRALAASMDAPPPMPTTTSGS